jgi:hypothetical protein
MKKIWSILACLCLLLGTGISWPTQVGAQEPATCNFNLCDHIEGLIFYWTMDDSSNPGRDLCNINNGTVGGATWSGSGQVGGSLYFNGWDYVSSPLAYADRPYDTFTFEAWVKSEVTHEIDGEGHGYTSYDGTSGQRYVFWPEHGVGGGDCGAGVSVGTNGISVYEHSSNYMPAVLVYNHTIGSGWNHIAVVYRDRVPSLYVNGVLVRTTSASARQVYAPGMIGSTTYGVHQGYIDEAAVYSRALDADEIALHYSLGISGYGYWGSQQRMVAYWQMNQSSGVTVKDSTPLHLNGTKLPNQPAWVPAGIANQFENYECDGYALSFDGLDDSVTVPDTGYLDISSQLTAVFWVKPNPSQGSNATVIDRGYASSDKLGWKFHYNDAGNQICFTLGDGTNSTRICDTGQINDDRWHQVAGVVDGKQVLIYVDGVLKDGALWPHGIGIHNRPLLFGKSNETGANFFKGGLDEFALYDYAFDAWEVTVAYEDWTYGVIGRWNFGDHDGVGPGSHVWDASNQDNDGTIVSAALVDSTLGADQMGATTDQALTCDGDGYLLVDDSNSLHVAYVTMESWIKPTISSGNRIILGKEGEWGIALFDGNVFKSFVDQSSGWYGTTTVPLNDWTHVAASWDGEYLRNYINGELIDTYALPDGWVDFTSAQVGICKKWAPMGSGTGNDSNTKLLLHLDGSNGATLFTDASATNHTPEAVGNASITTSVNKFGQAAIFDGSGDYIRVPDSNDWDLGSGDFTIDAWVYLNALPSSGSMAGIGGQWQDGNNGWYLAFYNNGGPILLRFADYASGFNFKIDATVSISTGVWYHTAVVRVGNTFKLFLNGTQVGSDASYSSAISNFVNYFYVGSVGLGSYLNGAIDEFRFSKGVARWTTSFTPPSSPYGAGISFNDFTGELDNVTVWNHPRDPEEIEARAMYVARSGWPVAKISSPPNDYSVKTGISLSFDASTSLDPAGLNKGIVEYLWDFGDGTYISSTTSSINHTFSEVGTFPVYLSVKDGDGNFGGTFISIEVKTSLTLSDHLSNMKLKAQAKAAK